MKFRHIYLFHFWLNLVIFSYCFITENENIARSRPAYQRLTKNDSNIAKLATGNEFDYELFSETDSGSKNWFVVDLGGLYKVTEVCIWNKGDVGKLLSVFFDRLIFFNLLIFFIYDKS